MAAVERRVNDCKLDLRSYIELLIRSHNAGKTNNKRKCSFANHPLRCLSKWAVGLEQGGKIVRNNS